MLIRFMNFLFHMFSLQKRVAVTYIPKYPHWTFPQGQTSTRDLYVDIASLLTEAEPEVFFKKMFLKFLEFHRKTSVLKFLFIKTSRLGLGQVFSYKFCKFLRTRTPPGDCFWFSTSSVEAAGSNQGITVLIDAIIPLYNLLIKVFHNSVKESYLFCKARIWPLICFEHSRGYVTLCDTIGYNVNIFVL